MNQSEVIVGACFVTKTLQMREVVGISDGKVTYASWSAKQERPQNANRVTVGIEKFCEDVDRSVPPSFRSGFGE